MSNDLYRVNNGYGYGVRAEAETSATNNYDVLLTRFITKPLLNNVSFTTSDTGINLTQNAVL